VWSFGDGIENVTESPLTIHAVTLDSVEGMTLVDVVRAPAEAGVGAVPRFPPRSVAGEVWAQAQPVGGQVLEPGELAYLVLGFELDEAPGRAEGLVVAYELNGEQYEAVKDSTFTIRRRC
jgi:hypothetical protein